MFYEIIIVTIISLILTYIRRGRFKLKNNLYLKGYKILIIIAAIEIIAVILYKKHLINNFILNINWIIYIVILIFTALNIKNTYMKLFFIGTLMNFLAILFNDFKMPVLIADSIANAEINRQFLLSGNDLIHSLLTDKTNFKILCDIIILPPPYPFAKTLSIGDLFLLTGVFVFWQNAFSNNAKM